MLHDPVAGPHNSIWMQSTLIPLQDERYSFTFGQQRRSCATDEKRALKMLNAFFATLTLSPPHTFPWCHAHRTHTLWDHILKTKHTRCNNPANQPVTCQWAGNWVVVLQVQYGYNQTWWGRKTDCNKQTPCRKTTQKTLRILAEQNHDLPQSHQKSLNIKIISNKIKTQQPVC